MGVEFARFTREEQARRDEADRETIAALRKEVDQQQETITKLTAQVNFDLEDKCDTLRADALYWAKQAECNCHMYMEGENLCASCAFIARHDTGSAATPIQSLQDGETE